ncbi:MAG: tetratricopeptide repeat protein [Alphaproteobacteria bacterium]|nr:tetratricopeptide repeat protein [Alphaproteobacteria bacterium]
MKLGKDRDLRLKRRKAARADPEVDRLVAQAMQRHATGASSEARRLVEAALARRPDYPAALNALGLALGALGEHSAAVEKLTEATALAPSVAAFHVNRSRVLRSLLRAREAVAAAREAVRLEPASSDYQNSLAAALLESGQAEAAIAPAREAVRLDPGLVEGWRNLANALARGGPPTEAEATYRRVIEMAPHWFDPWMGLGRLYLSADREEETMAAYRRALELRRPTRWWPIPGAAVPRPPQPALANTVKLRHDIEQFRWLAERGRLPAGAETLIPRYEQTLAQFIARHGRDPNAALTWDQWEAIGDAFNRVLVWEPPSPVQGSALGSFDRAAAERQYGVGPGICWVDDFLSAEALAAIRRFCLESTIWSDIAHNFQGAAVARAYLGSYLHDGFVAPILLQVQRELREAMPAVFANRRLGHMWAYKYEAELQGIGIHGDDAAVNVNFWITPDEANLDPGGGGLIVYPAEAPADWSFDEINLDADRMWRFVRESGAEPVNVPHRQNRAVIFNSDLFHATAPLRFRPGYENRRINVTMLFGGRGG